LTLARDVEVPADALPLEMFVGGEWRARLPQIEVRNPFDGSLAGLVPSGTAEDVAEGVDRAIAALSMVFPAHLRYEVLQRAAARIEAKAEEYARDIAAEGSKTIREARREPPRAANLLRLSAEEGRRIAGETLPFDSRAGSENRAGYYFRVPAGIVAAIAPFNDPLAVAAHKVGPALAAGNAVILKPSLATPLSALRLARDLSDAGLPEGRLSVITGGDSEVGETLVTNPRVRVVSFTGGVATGERIARTVGIKKLLMELGSNSPVIVLPDADLDRAVPAIASGAFAQAGQNCIGVQRVLIHTDVYGAFRERFLERVATLKTGCSRDESTDVCAMINKTQAVRVEQWITEAVAHGARVIAGGHRNGAVFEPTVLENIPSGARLDQDEIYGPVVSLYRVASLDEAIELANSTRYGIHAAIFTESIRDAFTAIRRLEVGGVMINDSTDYRLDVMPFGGPKMSGISREGIRFALEEMTETRVVCFNL
jgi:glyceraldehyde-3-phosphate dehydrogenase (NADP+)